MPIPDSPNFSFGDVVTEMGLIGATTLGQLFSASNKVGFDRRYQGAFDSLGNFRNYDHGAQVSTANNNIGFSRQDANEACSESVFNPRTYYLNGGATIFDADKIYSDSRKFVPAPSGFYSDGYNWKYWNGRDQFWQSGDCNI